MKLFALNSIIPGGTPRLAYFETPPPRSNVNLRYCGWISGASAWTNLKWSATCVQSTRKSYLTFRRYTVGLSLVHQWKHHWTISLDWYRSSIMRRTIELIDGMQLYNNWIECRISNRSCRYFKRLCGELAKPKVLWMKWMCRNKDRRSTSLNYHRWIGIITTRNVRIVAKRSINWYRRTMRIPGWRHFVHIVWNRSVDRLWVCLRSPYLKRRWQLHFFLLFVSEHRVQLLICRLISLFVSFRICYLIIVSDYVVHSYFVRFCLLTMLNIFQIMEPVRTLRRICSILHVTDKEGNTIVMRPQQMLQYLINTNITNAKSELDSIFSRLKSFVALSTGKHKNRDVVAGKASKTCQNVLTWSKEYQNEPTMYVCCLWATQPMNHFWSTFRIDSLLQIKVGRFLTWIKNRNYFNNVDVQLLEKNFYSSQLDALTNFKADRQKDTTKFSEFESYFQKNCVEWTRTILTDWNTDLQLISQIKNRTNAAYENVM